MKATIGLALFLSTTLLVMSCNSGEATDQRPQVRSTVNQSNDYFCTMHPEVTGKEGDKCPKCGMALVPKVDGAIGKLYSMELTSIPAHVKPNEEITLSLVPTKKNAPNEQVLLDVEHEKKIHLILVSDDLSWFAHIHPEPATDGSYRVKAKFPTAGRYLAFADYKPTGGTHIVDKVELLVEGTASTAQNVTTEKLSGNSGKYSFTISPKGEQFFSGESMQMDGVIKKEGKTIDVNTLTNYLGAKAHIVVIGLSEKEYLHVHPEVVDGKFNIRTTFAKPGIYRGWIQFNGDDQLHTIDFTLQVKQGVERGSEKERASNDSMVHSDHHSGHH